MNQNNLNILNKWKKEKIVYWLSLNVCRVSEYELISKNWEQRTVNYNCYCSGMVHNVKEVHIRSSTQIAFRQLLYSI